MFNQFRAFFRRTGVIQITAGVALALALQQAASELTTAVIVPSIGALVSEPELFLKTVTVNESAIYIGQLIAALITLLIVVVTVYFLFVRPMHKRGEQAAAKTRDCPECESRISATAIRCAHCTAVVGPAA